MRFSNIGTAIRVHMQWQLHYRLVSVVIGFCATLLHVPIRLIVALDKLEMLEVRGLNILFHPSSLRLHF